MTVTCVTLITLTPAKWEVKAECTGLTESICLKPITAVGWDWKEHSENSHTLLLTTERCVLTHKRFLLISAPLVLQKQHQSE